MRLCASLSRGVAAPLGCVIFSVSVEIAACMPCTQGLSVCARRGVVSLPSERFTRFGTPAWPGLKTANFAAFGSWPGCSRRTQKACGTAMRLCASLFRRRRDPAGLRNPFSFLSKLRLVCPALRAFPCVRGEGWYHYPQRALRAAETPDGRLSKRLICRFLRSGGRSSPHDSYFLANTQNFLLAVPVANTPAVW